MKVGDLIWDNLDKRYGILMEKDWYSMIETPFDWLVFWCDDGSLWGGDERDFEVISESR